MTDKNKFKDTLNLPTTSFSLRANAAEKEPALRTWWRETGIEKEYFAQSGTASFVLHDGPPYANGHIHLGHALNKVLKDTIVRVQRLAGKNVQFRPGWDCHGLPIELKVTAAGQGGNSHAGLSSIQDKEPGLSTSESDDHIQDAVAFKRACRTYAQQWQQTQETEFKDIGVWAQWENPYITMNPHYQATIIRCLGEFVAKGHVERKGKTVPWCFSCQTVLANAEIEYADRKDPSCYILFPLTDELRGKAFADIDSALQLNVLIWTTTPWTIPLNRAVVLHPDAQYALVQVSDTQACLVGADLVEKLSEVLGADAKVIKTLHSSELAGSKVQHPLVDDLQVPVITDHGVSTTDGTACLHSAPGCGPEDYMMGVKNGLEIFSPLSSDGFYTEGIKPVELLGEKITDGQWWVLKQLKERGVLLHKANIKHSYPHCWRCQNGLMFRATDQWFCNLEKNNLITNAQKALDTVDFIPAWGKTRLHSFLDNRTEWCISRQRRWGVPIPALFNSETEEVYTSQEFMNAVAGRVAQEGIEFWDRVTIAELREAGLLPTAFAALDDTQIRKETDILDVWFDSGVSHRAAISAAGGTLPVDLYLEGSDQHRGWFQSSHLSSMVLNNKAQTKAILTHGFVVDKDGHKMSKSRGNVVDPQAVIKKYGVDVLRLWVASVDYERDVVISDELLKNTAEVYRKLRNTARFLLMNLYDFNPRENAVPYAQLGALDAYALRETLRVNDEVIELYKNYKFANAIQVLTKYCTTTLSSFYLDMVKDRLYVEGANSRQRRSAQTVLHVMVQVLTRLLAPVLVHAAEDMHQSLPYEVAEKSIHLTEFYAKTQEVPAGDDAQWRALEALRVEVLRAIEQQREAGVIKHSLEAKVALSVESLKTSHPGLSGISLDEAFLKEWFIVSQVTIADGDITVSHADGVKCPRCWHWSTSEQTDGLCERCTAIVPLSKA